MNGASGHKSERLSKAAEAKIILIGDCKVGKTCLIMSYARNGFCEDYSPTVQDSYIISVDYLWKPMKLFIFDISGKHTELTISPNIVDSCDVWLLCFSLVNRNSFDGIKSFWINKIPSSGKKSVILVGTQCDLVKDPRNGRAQVSSSEGIDLAKKIGAKSYVECSALTQKNTKILFDFAIESSSWAFYMQENFKEFGYDKSVLKNSLKNGKKGPSVYLSKNKTPKCCLFKNK